MCKIWNRCCTAKQMLLAACYLLVSSCTGNFTIDRRESLVTIIFLPHFIVKRMIKHGMKFLFGHVRIGIQHLKTVDAKTKISTSERICRWNNEMKIPFHTPNKTFYSSSCLDWMKIRNFGHSIGTDINIKLLLTAWWTKHTGCHWKFERAEPYRIDLMWFVCKKKCQYEC